MLWLEIISKLLSGFSGLQLFFFVCAVVGGFLFLIRLVLMIFSGGGHDLEPGMEMGADVDIAGDSDVIFRFISVQGIVGFLLILGLTGLSMSVQLEASNAVSVSTAFGAGAATMAIIAWITVALRKLDQPGTISMKNAIGQEGTVYLTIPEGGTGKARIIIQNRLRVFDAISKDKSSIETEARVKVVEIVGGNTLVVERT